MRDGVPRRLIDREGSLAAFVWRYAARRGANACEAADPIDLGGIDLPCRRTLKKQGWKFVGPTTVYAFMQAMGLINDHVEGCAVRADVERARQKFERPGR